MLLQDEWMRWSYIAKLSQMVTYLICDWWVDIQKCLISEVR